MVFRLLEVKVEGTVETSEGGQKGRANEPVLGTRVSVCVCAHRYDCQYISCVCGIIRSVPVETLILQFEYLWMAMRFLRLHSITYESNLL